MNGNEGGMSCGQATWLMALGAAVLAAVLLMVLGDWRLIQAGFALVVIALVLGPLMSWMFCRPLPALGETPRQDSNENPAPTNEASAKAAAAQARAGAEPAPQTQPAAAAAAAKAGVKPSKELAGEAELAARKGTWKYEGEGGTPSGKSASKAAEKTAAKAAAPAADAEMSDADAPERLSAARGDGADDLKQIKGVGPKLEKLLNSMGFYHFDQIASWTGKEVAWVDENLEGFKGRVSRDNWVEQAKTLAAGGSTEFSEKVDKGDVY